jgi:ADP-ribosylglycohydrolase
VIKDEINKLLINIISNIETQILYCENITSPEIQAKKKICETINNALNGEIINIRKNKSNCLNCLYCSILGIMYFDDYKNAIDFIINLGGDTNANACVSGALLGALYGYEHIVSHNSDNIEILRKSNCDIFNDKLDEKIKDTSEFINNKYTQD